RCFGFTRSGSRMDARCDRVYGPHIPQESVRLSHSLPCRQTPARPHEVASVAARNAFEIILVLRFRFPEGAGWRQLGHHLSRPEPGCVYIRDGVLRDLPLFLAGIEDGRTIARASIVALAVQSRRIVNLEEKFQQLPVADFRGIENDLDGFGMRAVIAIGGVGHIASGIADPGRDDARIATDQILHSPEAATGKNRTFWNHFTSSTWSDKR